MSKKYIILILIIVAVSLLIYKAYNAEVQDAFQQYEVSKNEILTEKDKV